MEGAGGYGGLSSSFTFWQETLSQHCFLIATRQRVSDPVNLAHIYILQGFLEAFSGGPKGVRDPVNLAHIYFKAFRKPFPEFEHPRSCARSDIT